MAVAYIITVVQILKALRQGKEKEQWSKSASKASKASKQQEKKKTSFKFDVTVSSTQPGRDSLAFSLASDASGDGERRTRNTGRVVQPCFA